MCMKLKMLHDCKKMQSYIISPLLCVAHVCLFVLVDCFTLITQTVIVVQKVHGEMHHICDNSLSEVFLDPRTVL